MKVITTNLLNRFWKNGVKPIKDTIAGKLDASKVVNSLLTTSAGYALDARQGKALDDKITELNSKLVYPVSFTNIESTTIKVTAPYDCWIEITHSFLGWGYAGGLYTFSITEANSDSIKATPGGDSVGGCQGGDTTYKFLCAKAIYKNLKKGNSYTFQKIDVEGRAGALKNMRFLAICHPE